MFFYKNFGFEFHDLPINSLLFDFDKEIIELIVSVYDEDKDNYQVKSIKFKDATNVFIEGNITMKNNSYEINGDSDDITNIKDIYYVKLGFFQDCSYFTLNLECGEINMEFIRIDDQ